MPRAEWKRENIWLRLALLGITKSGKTSGALTLATHLFGGKLPITLLDTENRRAALYSNVYDIAYYRTITGSYAPDVFVKELDDIEAENRGGILIIDSASHEWSNSGGVLQIADKGKGSNWKEATPAHLRFTNRIAALNMHVIVCVRSKMKWDYPTNESGKVVPTKLGLGPDQRDNFLYDYDIEGEIDFETHNCTFAQRVEPGSEAPLNGLIIPLVPNNDPRADNQAAKLITEWLSVGSPMQEPPEAAADLDVENLRGLLREEGFDDERIERGFSRQRAKSQGVLPVEYVVEQTENSLKRLEEAKHPEGTTNAERAEHGESAATTERAAGSESADPPERAEASEGADERERND